MANLKKPPLDRTAQALLRAARICPENIDRNTARSRLALKQVLRNMAPEASGPKSSANDEADAQTPAQDWARLASAVMKQSELWPRLESSSAEFMEKMWPNLEKHRRNDIDALAEGYASPDDYWKQRELTAGARNALETHFDARALYRESIETELNSLYGAEAQKMSCDSSYSKRRIGEVVASIKRLLHLSFGLSMAAGRPIDSETEERHRHWSKLRYQGRSWNQIVAEDAKRGAASHNKDHIRTAVEEYRQRREPIQRILRWLIFLRANGRGGN
jgi:hypothetical protein